MTHDVLYSLCAYGVILGVVTIPGIYAYRKWKKSISSTRH